MTEQGRPKPSDELRQYAAKRPHLREHLKKFKQITGEFPMFIDEAKDEFETDRPNVLYMHFVILTWLGALTAIFTKWMVSKFLSI